MLSSYDTTSTLTYTNNLMRYPEVSFIMPSTLHYVDLVQFSFKHANTAQMNAYILYDHVNDNLTVFWAIQVL